MIEPENGGEFIPHKEPEACAGWRFHDNGDLETAHARGNVFVHVVMGSRDGKMVRVDSYCTPRDPECGCMANCHAVGCPKHKA